MRGIVQKKRKVLIILYYNYMNIKIIKYYRIKILEKTNWDWDNPQWEYLFKIYYLILLNKIYYFTQFCFSDNINYKLFKFFYLTQK